VHYKEADSLHCTDTAPALVRCHLGS
jgi:hypothetical protein